MGARADVSHRDEVLIEGTHLHLGLAELPLENLREEEPVAVLQVEVVVDQDQEFNFASRIRKICLRLERKEQQA